MEESRCRHLGLGRPSTSLSGSNCCLPCFLSNRPIMLEEGKRRVNTKGRLKNGIEFRWLGLHSLRSPLKLLDSFPTTWFLPTSRGPSNFPNPATFQDSLNPWSQNQALYRVDIQFPVQSHAGYPLEIGCKQINVNCPFSQWQYRIGKNADNGSGKAFSSDRPNGFHHFHNDRISCHLANAVLQTIWRLVPRSGTFPTAHG